MLIGLVEVNDRKYCVGMWKDLAHMSATLQNLVCVKEIDVKRVIDETPENERRWLGEHFTQCHKAYQVTFTTAWYDLEERPIYGFYDDDFNAYEYVDDNYPGFLGGDED